VHTVYSYYIQLFDRQRNPSEPALLLNLTDLSDEPLHGQMSRQIRSHVLSGRLKPGAALPSIRSMARDHRVSVITVQRAYDDLEREGLLRSRRGKGVFVAELPPGGRRAMASEKAHAALSDAIEAALADGLGVDQIEALVAQILTTGGDG